jgi:ATP-dependent HslUV protease subunit HslV
MVVADAEHIFQITGGGDVIEPHEGIIGIGSGGPFATAAARALMDVPGMSAADICGKAMTIAADTCVYTNHNFVTETIGPDDAKDEGETKDKELLETKDKKKDKK